MGVMGRSMRFRKRTTVPSPRRKRSVRVRLVHARESGGSGVSATVDGKFASVSEAPCPHIHLDLDFPPVCSVKKKSID